MTVAPEVLAASPSRRKWLPLGSMLALGTLVAFVALLKTEASFFAAVLLSLSICLDYLVLREQRPDSRFSNELANCETVKVGFVWTWIVFERWSSPPAAVIWGLSAAAFAVAMIVATAMVGTAAKLMRPESGRSNRWSYGSLDELRSDKVLALCGLVVAFLHITYFLAFALAFSDRYGRGELWAVRLAGAKARSVKSDSHPAAAPHPEAAASGCSSGDATTVRKFFFVQSAATLACTETLDKALEGKEALQKEVCSEGMNTRRQRFETLGVCGVPHPGQYDVYAAAAWNLHELYALRSVFRKDAHGPDSNSYLVEVRGHANDASVRNGPAPPYGSNYEISKQRADQVTLLLQSEFRRATEGRAEPSIRWLSYGVSNEESFLEPSLNPDAPTTDRKLTVEVNVQTVAAPFADGKARDTQIDVSKMVGASSLPRELDLIDYLYFTIYTITTTGYGDIVPISSWAKFLVSIANLIELLFLVVLVNVIANVRPANADGAGDTDANRS